MAVILMAVVASLATFSSYQAAVTDKSSQNLLDLKRSVRDASNLGQVLKEYLEDIETVEATGSPCVDDHRTVHSRAQGSLESQLDKCGQSRSQKEPLEKCLEEHTKSIVSDIRQNIVKLKTCVDRC